MNTARYLVADVFDGLATLEDGSVDLVVTSPPLDLGALPVRLLAHSTIERFHGLGQFFEPGSDERVAQWYVERGCYERGEVHCR